MLYRALYKSAKECYATFRSGLVGRSNCTITYIYYSLSIFCSIYHGILQMHLTCRIYQLLLSTSKVAREILFSQKHLLSQLGDLTVEFPSRGDSHGPVELVAQSL